MVARIQITELATEGSAVPYVIAVLVGLVAGGAAPLLLAARFHRSEEPQDGSDKRGASTLAERSRTT